MKIKSLKNFFLYNGRKISTDEIVDLSEPVAVDLIKGKYAVEYKEKITRRKSKVGDE